MDKPSLKSLQDEATRLAETARERAAETAEEIKVASNQLVDKVRALIEEGNVRRVIVKRGDRVLLEFPLTVGVGAGAAGLIFSPVLTALGALAAVVSDLTLVIERTDEHDAAPRDTAADPLSPESVGAPASPEAGKTVGRPAGDAGSGSSSGPADPPTTPGADA
ncbi:MAG: DUF4342 domain-containing protein [Rubricoccaceae bacterium]